MLLDLLERNRVLDYIQQHSEKSRRGGGSHASRGGPQIGVVTWTSLFHSVLGYVDRETEAIQKQEDKGSAGSAVAQSNRITKKKVMTNVFGLGRLVQLC